MKNLKPFLFAFSLFLIQSCVNQQPNNVVEQNTIATSSDANDIYHPVSVIQNDTFSVYKKYYLKKQPLRLRGYSIPIVTIEPNEGARLSAKSADTSANTILPTPLLKTSFERTFPKKSQFFTINTQKETVLKGTEGTTLTIPKDCFETETGSILRGVVKVELKEFLKTSDMVLANLVTQSDEKLLETGGMIYLNATDSEGNPVRIRSDEDIKITLPKTPKAEDKQLFYGEKSSNDRINWRLPNNIKDNFYNSGFNIIDQSPEFPDGQSALFKFFKKKLVYPNIAWQNRIEGTVYVSFTVSKSGFIDNVQVKRGIGSGCNEEAIRVIKSMPRWKPGRRNGIRVPTNYTLPVSFKLRNRDLPKNETLTEVQDSLTFANDSVRINKLLEIEDTQEYVMSTQKLGWINCDRFLNLQNTERTDFVIWHNKPEADICLVFKNYRTIVGAWNFSDQKVHFANIPIGQPIFIVATSSDGGNFNISITETVVSKDQSATIELKAVEKEAFIKELHRLDAVNQ